MQVHYGERSMKQFLSALLVCVTMIFGTAQEPPVIQQLTLSPDGTLVTFKVVEAQIAAEYFGDVPGTLVRLELETDTLHILSVQPETFSCEQEGCRAGNWQGTPVFSPDGSQIAWAETGETSGLVMAVHTIATQETVRYPNVLKLGFQDGSDFALPYLEWGASGILNRYSTNLGVADFHVLLDIIDPATRAVMTLDLHSYDDDSSLAPSIVEWAMLNGEQVLAFGYSTGLWEVVDLNAQTVTPTSEQLRGLVRRAGETEPAGVLQYVFGEIDGDPNPRVMIDPAVNRTLDAANVAILLNEEQRQFVMGAVRAMLTANLPDVTAMDEGDEFTASALMLDGSAGEAAAPSIVWQFEQAPDGESRPLIIISGEG